MKYEAPKWPIDKYFLYCKPLKYVQFQFADFETLVHEKIEAEKYVTVKSNKRGTSFF